MGTRPTTTVAAPTEAGHRHPWADIVREVAADRVDRAVFAVVLVAIAFADSILLPFDFTQRISFANWQYLDARYVAFAIAFALTMAWVLTLQVHAMRKLLAGARAAGPRAGGPLGALAAVVSLLPSFLCCSPIVPTLVGLFGLSAGTQLRTTGSIEYFFATKQNWLLLGSLALVVASGLWSMRKLARATCLDEVGCALTEGPRQVALSADERIQAGPGGPDALVRPAGATAEERAR